MGLALRLYEQLAEAKDDSARFRLIVDAIGQLEEGWPRAGEIARASDVRESELRLQREIEVVRKETKEVELNLQKQIKEVELSLQKEIKDAELRMRKAMHQQTVWVVGAVGTVVGLVRLLDWLLA
jgi:hypothetical protein